MAASFGQLVKEQRIEMGLTQQRLADLVGRSPSTVRSWERDRATPNDEVVIASLADVLGIGAGILSELAGVEFSEAPSDRGSSAEATEAMGPISSSLQESTFEPVSVIEPELHTAPVPSSDETPFSVDELSVDEPVAVEPLHPTAVPFSRSGSDWGPDPGGRTAAPVDEPRTAGPMKASEPAKPYVLHTDRSSDSPGPERVESARGTLFGDEPPEPKEPPADWDAEIDLDEMQDPNEEEPEPMDHVDDDGIADPAVGAAPEMALAGVMAEPGFDGAWDDEPTQILMASAPAEERLLGVATATVVEFVAEPRARLEPIPEVALDVDATEVISRAPLVDPLPTVEAVPQTMAPVAAARPVARSAQPRTQTMETGRPIGPNSYLEDPHEIRGYRIRAGLTAAAMIAMLIVARWAWSGFREQLSGILDTLTTGF